MEKRHGPRPTETVAAGLLFSAAGDGADVRPSCKNNGGRIKISFLFFGGGKNFLPLSVKREKTRPGSPGMRGWADHKTILL